MPAPSSSAGRVRAKTTNRSAIGALVMNRFCPLMIQSVPTVANGFRAQARRIRPRAGLGQREGGHDVAGRHALEPAGLLLVGAEPDEHLTGDAVVGAEHRPQRQRRVAQLHGQLDILGEIQAEAAPLLRDRVAEQPHLLGLLAKVVGHPVVGRGSPARAERPRCGRSDGSGPGSPGNPRR